MAYFGLSQFGRQVPEILLIYLYHTFRVSCCKIGPKEVLGIMLWLKIYIYCLHWLNIYHDLMLQLTIPNPRLKGASSYSSKSVFFQYQVFILYS